MREARSSESSSKLARLALLLKKAAISLGLVAGGVFSAIAWVHEATAPTLRPLRAAIDDDYLFWQISLPVIAGLFASTITILYIAAWRWQVKPKGSSSLGLVSTQIFPVDKIEKLKWSRLETKEKESLYHTFHELSPKASAPISIIAAPERQLLRQSEAPINLSYLRPLSEIFGLDYDDIHFPLDESSFQRLNDFRSELLQSIRSRENIPLKPRVRQLLQELYDYLACHEYQPSLIQRRSIDCVLVAAARWSLEQRVDEAIKQYRLSGCDLILTGGRPSYDDSDQPPVAEAEIMDYYLDLRRVDKSQLKIYLDTRSCSSYEALWHSLPFLNSIVASRGRPVTLGIITSSYHMRRFYSQALELLAPRSHLVAEIFCLTVPAAVDFSKMVVEQTPLTGRSLVVLQTFLSEYLKLVAGRVVGEF